MKKREFLKASTALVSGSVLTHIASALPALTPIPTPDPIPMPDSLTTPAPTSAILDTPGAATSARTNWSGNYTYHARALRTPATPTDLTQLVQTPSLPLKALGTRHSFNNMADSHGDQVAFPHFNSIDIDPQARTVTVGAGITYGRLAPVLDAKGFALANLASLPHISVAGGTATGTHGSGVKNQNLSSSVVALEITTPKGPHGVQARILRRNPSLSPDQDPFHAAVVHLGALGLVTHISLAIEPTYQMRQIVYQNLSFDTLAQNFLPILSAGYSVSLFTDWQNHRVSQVWIKSRLDPRESPSDSIRTGAHFHIPPEFYGAKAATRNLHPLEALSPENCTEQLGVPGPWYERLPHFRLNFTPSSGQELQTEYFVSLAHGMEAIHAVEQIRDRITPHLLVTELRTIAADDLWLSPCYHQDSMALHFTWKPDWPQVREVLPLLEKQLAPFHPRPHWAKLFTIPGPQIRSQYPRMQDFLNLRQQTDPQGQLLNDYLQTNLLSI